MTSPETLFKNYRGLYLRYIIILLISGKNNNVIFHYRMKYIITGDDFSITDSIRDYIEKRFSGFDRFLDDKSEHEMLFIVGKDTAHARENTFYAEVRFKIHERDFFARGEASDEMAAIDIARDELMREVTHSNQKRRTLFHRGARKIKELIRRVNSN